MGMGVRVRVWGDYALFSRPELKVERCSYDVMTPSAARGILEAIYWHPGMRWIIDKIYVKKPIQFTSVRRNEVKSKILASNVLQVYNGADKPLYISSKSDIVQRASLLLRDVEYVIEAHFEMTENANASDNAGGGCGGGNAFICHISVVGSFRHISAFARKNRFRRLMMMWMKKTWVLCFTTLTIRIKKIFSLCFSGQL